MQRSSLLLCYQPLSYILVRCLARLHRSFLVAIALCLVVTVAASAQSSSDRQWVVFRQSDGLASNDVFSLIIQSNTVWVGTSNGVSRYDGQWQTFATAKSSDTRSADAGFGKVTALAAENTSNDVWAANDQGMLARWQEATGWRVEQMLGMPIHALAAGNGRLWIGAERGLFLLHAGILTPIEQIGEASVLSLAYVNDVLWAGGTEFLWQVSSDLTAIQVTPSPDGTEPQVEGPFTGIWAYTPNHIWFATVATVFEYSTERAEITEYTPPFGNETGEITAITGVNQESVWVASNGGGAAQYRLAGKDIASMRSWGGFTQGGLSANNVRSIAVDADGSVWFATSIGVFRYQPWSFQTIDEQLDSLPVNDLLFDRKGQLWVATGGEGIQLRAERYRQPVIFSPDNSGLPGGFVYALEEDTVGRIWAFTDQGVAYFDAENWRQPAALRSFNASPIGVLKADELGIWIGCARGLFRYQFDDASLRNEPFLDGHPIGAIGADSLGRLWVASIEGALWMRSAAGNWRNIARSDAEAPHDAPVTAIFAEAEPPGSILAAVKGFGIYRIQDSGWEDVDEHHKGGDDRVFAMMSNPDSNSVWVGGETGLARFDPYGLATFDSQDGLQLGAIRAMTRDEDGAYWFGGARGVSYYVPERSAPWIHVLEIEGDESRIRGNEWQVWADQAVEINFAYGDLQTEPEKLQVFVRLVAAAQIGPWQQLPSGVYHTSLQAIGDYTLEYMVRDQAFNYSPINSVALTVIPALKYTDVPFLGKVESRIFQLLVLFGFLAFFGFGYVSFEIVQHRRRINDAVARGYNPYISGEPVRREDMFFGRHELLQRIVSTLHNNSIMIHGERRIGKTTLLYQLANTLRQIDDSEYWFVALYVDLEGTTEDTFFHLLIDEITQHVCSLEYLNEVQRQTLDALSHHTTLTTEFTDRAFSRDLRQIIHLLETYGAEHHVDKQLRLILLMDEMDTLSRYNHLIQQQLRRIFMREFAASVGAVVAGIEINKDWERVESPWFNLFNEIAMQPFARDEAIRLLVEPVRGCYIFEPAAVDFVLQKSEGRPHRIQQYAMEAVNEMLRHKRRRITMHDVTVAHEIIQWDSRAAISQTVAPAADVLPMGTPSPGAA